MIQPLWKRDSEGGQLIPGYWEKVDSALTAGKCVAELAAGGQGGGACGKNLQIREKVGADLQKPRRVAELMDFVENYHRFVARVKKKLRVVHPFFHYWKVTVNVKYPSDPRLSASVVLPHRRVPQSQTMGASSHACSIRFCQNGLDIM
jgi:hypothetical protein